MSILDATAPLTQGAVVSFNGHRLRTSKGISNLTPGGEADEVEISDFGSPAKEFKQTLRDSGTIEVSINSAVHSPAYQELISSNRSSVVGTLRVTFGDIPSGARFTDGSGEDIDTAITFTLGSAPSGTQQLVQIPKAYGDTMPGVIEGDLFGDGTNEGEITAIAETSTHFELTTTSTALAAGSTGKVIRPAWQIVYAAYVRSLPQEAQVANVVEGSVVFRINGEPTTNVGTPALTTL